MKRFISIVLCTVLGILAFFPAFSCAAVSDVAMPKVGDLATDIDVNALKDAGYTVVDDRDAAIVYTWPYTLDPVRISSDTALGGTLLSQFGQVSATISYTFHGTYLALLFAEHHYAADIIVTIDNVSYTAHNPYNADAPAGDLEGGVSRVVFVKDDLPEGEHQVTVTHKPGYNSGDENLKEDGQRYYDNVALFDAFIVKKEYSGSEPVDDLKVGNKTHLYDDASLDKLNLKVIDDTDSNILYTWPYDLDIAQINQHGYAMNGTVHFNVGQVGSSITILFEGTVLGIAFCETYFACKVIVDVDGEILGEFTPHSSVRSDVSDVPYQSKICFVKMDLKPGQHILTITHETAHESGEPNTKPDGQNYYDNNAYFDCIFVQKTPDIPQTESSADSENVFETEHATECFTMSETESVTESVAESETEVLDSEKESSEVTTSADNEESTASTSGGCRGSVHFGWMAVAAVVGVLMIKGRRKSNA